MIERELYPLLRRAGFESVRVSPRKVYVDAGKPEIVEGFTRNTFTAMTEGIREQAIAAGMIEPRVLTRVSGICTGLRRVMGCSAILFSRVLEKNERGRQG
jgi:hypothetical protein